MKHYYLIQIPKEEKKLNLECTQVDYYRFDILVNGKYVNVSERVLKNNENYDLLQINMLGVKMYLVSNRDINNLSKILTNANTNFNVIPLVWLKEESTFRNIIDTYYNISYVFLDNI